MERTILLAALTSLGIQTNKWVRTEEVTKVILSTDSNISNSLNDYGVRNADVNYFYFDQTSDLLKVKKYSNPEIVSSRFRKDLCEFKTNTIVVPAKTTFANKIEFPGQKIRGQSLRSPEVGDYVFVVDPITFKQIGTETKITSITYDSKTATLFLLNTIPMANNIVCWADGTKFLNSSALPADESIVIYTKPLTTNSFDTVIGFEFITGFELARRYEENGKL